jgi:hypothetical protein
MSRLAPQSSGSVKPSVVPRLQPGDRLTRAEVAGAPELVAEIAARILPSLFAANANYISGIVW